MDKLTPSVVVQDEVMERVQVASGVVAEGLAYLKVKHIVIFPVSWLVFFLLGRWFFDHVLGRYHATSSRYWAVACKYLFLTTFVACVNLLLLMIAEVNGFMHPTLRTVAWTSTLTVLCVLLNNVVPFFAATSMGRTLGLPRMLAGSVGVGTVLLAQMNFWFIGESFLTDKSETWKDHNSVSMVYFLYQQLLLKDLEHSVAIIAMMGTFISALIAGFATISFPMDYLLIFRGVNEKLLRTKERTHREVLRQIAERKRHGLITYGRPNASGDGVNSGFGSGSGGSSLAKSSVNSGDELSTPSSAHDTTAIPMLPSRGGAVKNRRNANSAAGGGGATKKKPGLRASISLSLGKITAKGRGEYKELFKDLARANNYITVCYNRSLSILSHMWNRIDSLVDYVIMNCRAMYERQGYQPLQWNIGPRGTASSGQTTDIAILEQISQDIFNDILHSHELREQAIFAHTPFGKAIWWCGFTLTFVGITRLYYAFSHVASGFLYTFVEKGSDEETSTFADIAMELFDMDRASWEASLNVLVIMSLGAFQIRAFLGSMMISARLGFLSTNTELYALVLAYLSGFYFIASVVLLRTQLPSEYRKGVTLALGQFSFDYFEWLFDRVYISSSIGSLFYLWNDARRKKAASRRFFQHDG